MNTQATLRGAWRASSSIVFAALLAAILLLPACSDDPVTPAEPSSAGADAYAADVATDWFALARDLTRVTPGFSPPVAARAFGYSGVALYEAVVPGMQAKGYYSLSGRLNGLALTVQPEIGAAYHWAASANAALAAMAQHLYRAAATEHLDRIAALEQLYRSRFIAEAGADIVGRSEQFGRAIAAAVYAWSVSDNGDECYKYNFPEDFTMPTGPGMWVPTPPAFQRCMQPLWGAMRPFVPASVMESQPPAPPAFSVEPSSAFYAEAHEVYTVTSSLTPEQRRIAQYWSDDPGMTATPGGHSIAVAGQLLQERNERLDRAAEVFARVGIGVHDAFVACWKAKYTYNLLRPVTYIREVIDADWMPVLATPPFPEYPSGHSVQSGAAARILADLFGAATPMTDRTHESRTDIDGTPRSFTSFEAMAQEAAMSRLYGGIHYRAAIELGLEQGRAVGARIAQLKLR